MLYYIKNKLNLISPQGIDEKDFSTRKHQGKFSTGFGTLMQIIKHQNEEMVYDIIKNAPNIDPDSADMIEEFSNIKFERTTDEEGGINMCKGMEICLLNTEIKGAISILRTLNLKEEDIAKRVASKYDVTIDYVKEIIAREAV